MFQCIKLERFLFLVNPRQIYRAKIYLCFEFVSRFEVAFHYIWFGNEVPSKRYVGWQEGRNHSPRVFEARLSIIISRGQSRIYLLRAGYAFKWMPLDWKLIVSRIDRWREWWVSTSARFKHQSTTQTFFPVDWFASIIRLIWIVQNQASLLSLKLIDTGPTSAQCVLQFPILLSLLK